ncbi:LpqB family beta-propeller domain-containing protein [Kribbella sp. VKM Ac-2566]|uniref:LpqB family beta-propeller domain-containing protein n=1 Tax=Kribbella sp. VKM Ac-2566 TaxID=2512218 RepID=UPI001063E572|nr:LpqB family beta-propeller domain-containing protein [Kribbella sp. VKM Ac-2566]TDX08525.1 sporulation and spore germination protein [Kribbella sp. VKM Ac-2566]
MRRRLVGFVLAVALLGGCATVPTKGTIRNGERQGLAPDLGGVGVEAKPPRANIGDMQIVSGFLEAMSDSQAYDVARQYMTPEAAGAWKPESQTVVYDQTPESLIRKGDGIQLTAQKIATIGARGEWTPAGPNEKADFFFKLKKVDGQLRVAKAPPGAFLGSNQVDLKLAPRDLYFFNQSRNLLVPDQVWLPQNLPSGQAATQLIQELLKGPTSRLGNGVVSIAPPGTEVQVSVPVDLGVATVALNDIAGSLRDQDRRLLAAQIVWTLNQLNLRAKITVGGAPLLPDEPEVLPFGNFSAYDPQATADAMTKLYGLLGQKPQRIVGLDGASEISAQPLNSGPLALHKAQSFAVTLAGDAGAIVTADGRRVVYGKLDPPDNPGKPSEIPVDGKTLSPSFDGQDNLWILDRADSDHPRLRVRHDDGRLSPVAIDFAGDTPVALRMAPDGVRALLVMHSAAAKQNYVETATVQTTNGGKQMMLGEFQPLRLQLTNITDAAWDKQGIIVIGTDKAAPQPWLVSTDGSSLQLLPGSAPGFVPEHVASNTHKDTLPVIQDDAGHIHWLSKDLGWVSMNDDDSEATIKPTYPG